MSLPDPAFEPAVNGWHNSDDDTDSVGPAHHTAADTTSPELPGSSHQAAHAASDNYLALPAARHLADLPDPDPIRTEPFTRPEWLNINSLIARVYQTGICDCANFAVWELGHGLENVDPYQSPEEADNRVAVACEWLTHAAFRLRIECISGTWLAYRDQVPRPQPEVPLHPGLTMRHWLVWEKRLSEIKETREVGPAVIAAVEETLDKMEEALVEVDKL